MDSFRGKKALRNETAPPGGQAASDTLNSGTRFQKFLVFTRTHVNGRLLLRFAHHEAEEEADFCHIGDGELSYGSHHGLVVFGRRVGHPGQFGLQGLSGGELAHLHDVAKTHPMLLGRC